MELPSESAPDPTLPRGVWRYQVDVRARSAMVLEINGGETGGEYREVMLHVDHPDADKGLRDIADMFVWGDVDPNFHPRISTAYTVTNPMRFKRRIPLVLSAGAGTKTINVRLRFFSGRTIDSTVTYALTSGEPHVSLLYGPFRKFLQTTDTVTLAWSCSHDVSQIYVGLADAYDTPRSGCALLTSGTNVNTGGSWAAGSIIQSSFAYADALAVYPSIVDVGSVFVRIFAVTSAGETS